MDNKITLVISAFPGTGKSYATEKLREEGFTVLDSDSSEFSWVVNKDGIKERNVDFPYNYINHIKQNIGKVDIIFVSSHDIVRKLLDMIGIKYFIFIPHSSQKEEYLKRYKDRGNDEVFIKLMDDNFDKWIEEIKNEKHSNRVAIATSLTYPYLYDYIKANYDWLVDMYKFETKYL